MEIMFARDGLLGITKQPTIVKKEGNSITPILFFQKAKRASKEDYDAAVNFLIAQAEKTMKKQ